MLPTFPSLLLLLLLAGPALLTSSTSQQLQVRGQRTPRDTKQDSIKVVITEGCATQGESSDVSQGGKEIDLVPGSPLVLTHKIKLIPSGSGSGPGSCGCEADFAVLRERLERLEREVSALREKCGGAEGGCCTSKESKGAGCSIKPDIDECPNECSDQGRCVDGRCVCFPGFSGPDCSDSNCPGNCNNNGKCVNGQCVCDPGFTGPDCSQRGCPDNCNNQGRCVNGKCVCNSGFTGPSCSDKSCPGNCNNRGRCVNGQCVCNPGSSGPTCSKRACPNNCKDRGRCVNGKCVCDSGFTGADCSENSCPGNCNNRGRCVKRQCVCNPGFTGPDCSQRACPDNCNNRGRCVNGKCVCDSGFTGSDCSEISCPSNCNKRGRCVNGQCVCNDGFTGADCSEISCPSNCNKRGRCVNGQCVCDDGFTGSDCSEISCPGNCNNRGRCVNGQCVCNDGFTGADCSEISCPGNCNNRGRCVKGQCVCNDGFTGADCSEISCPGNCNNRGRCVNGQCVCNDGFTGADCSEISCPGNCNNRGRCVNGQCVCNDGFTGVDCSEISCPGNCNNRGRCVNGQCVCDDGFTGSECSEISCPANCNNRGRCVNGQCVCNDGFTGQDCSEKACPNNCSNRGKCVNGKCVCNVGFAGPDCAAKGCPTNCNNKGRCVKGKCVCRRGFTGPDCSQCEEGMTGPNCDTVMSGVSQLSTREITETSVTLVWTPPPVQYDTYHITFTSQKESDQQINGQVEGSLTTFTQTGLAAGQEYTVSITGEIDGRRGAESSTQFMTLISGPTNLQVVKTTSTSAVVQWEQSQGEIDRYRMTVSPNDGAERSQEIIIAPGRESAHIQQLEAGHLYDIILVAEKGTSLSQPATTQAVPGKTLAKVIMAAVTTQVTPAPGQEVGDRDQEFNPSPENQVFDQQGRKEDGSEADSVKVEGVLSLNEDRSATVIAKTKPLVSRNDGPKPKLAERPVLSRKPNVPNFLRFNATRVVPGGRKVGPGALKKPPVGEKKKNKAPIVAKNAKPGAPTVGDRTIAVRDPSVEASSTERREDKNPAITSGTDSGTNSEEPTVGSKKQPDVGTAVQGSYADPVSSEPTVAGQSHEKKCMNKIKVTHIRLPHKDRGSGCRGDGTVLEGKTMSDLHQDSSETDDTPLKNNSDLKLLSAETELNYMTDPLHKLLTDTFDSLNITTFSVHLSKPAGLSDDAATVRKQILRGLKPLSSFSSSSSASSTSQLSSHSSPSQSSSSSSSSPYPSSALSSPQPSSSSSSSAESTSLTSSSTSTAASSSLTYLILSSASSSPSPPSSLPSLSPSPSSSSSSSSEKSDPVESNEPDVATDKSTTGAASPEDPKVPSREGGIPVFRRTPPKGGYIRRPRPNVGPIQNRTPRLNLKSPYRSASPLNLIPTRETETRHTPVSELSLSLSSSASEESSSVEVNAPVSDTSADKDEATTLISSGAEQNQKKMPTEGGRLTVRRLPPNGGYLRRPLPNVGPFQNRTRPNLRVRTRPAQLLNPAVESSTEPISSTESPASSSPPSSPKEKSYPAEGTGPGVEDTEGRDGASLPTEFNQTRANGVPSSDHPTSKVSYSRRPHLYVGSFQNRTRTNLRPLQPPHRSPMRKPFLTRKPNGSSSVTIGSQTIRLAKKNTPETPDNQSGEQGDNSPTEKVQIRQSGDQSTAGVINMGGHDTTVRPQTNHLEKGDNDPAQTTKSGEDETQTPESNSDSDIHNEQVNAAKNTGTTIQRRPIIKQTSSDSRASRPVTLPKRKPPTRRITVQSHTQMRHIGGSQRGEDPKTNHTAKLEFDSKTEQTRGGGSKSPTGSDVSSSGVTREPLNYVGVTNRTSNRFTVLWDAPQGKYKNFVVTKKEAGKDKEPKEKESRKEREEDSEKEDRDKEMMNKPTKETEAENGNTEDENRVPESVGTQVPTIQSIKEVKPATESDKTFKKVIPGSARSFQFEDLPPQTEYTVTLLGKGPGLLSKLHKLVISTGPEPPSNIIFSKVTENSLTVSWTKPKRPVSGFKVTYTHTDDGEPVSVSVDSNDSTLSLSQLSPGSSYEVSVISILGLDESDPIKDFVMTHPDPPTNLQAVNVTDTKAMLLWRPALATIDKYTIVYGSGKGSALRVTVSGNAAEQQLSGLEGSTTYTVTITSELGSLKSSAATANFTTTSGSGSDGVEPRDLQASQVTPRTALLSWKPPSKPAGSYRLTYQNEGQEMKEVIVDATVTEYNLTRLHPGSKYTVQLQAEGGGHYTSAISTDFTTGTLRFPFPTDCSQELLNGIRTSGEVEIFPQGKLGTPMVVYCDMETDGGGWTVFQRRKDGSVDFFRGWEEYIEGFGDLSGEFWLGLDSVHNLTATTRMSLLVDLRDGDESVFAKYSLFEVAKRNYRLTVGGYSGTAGDSLSYHNNRAFSTKDHDPAPFITRCAMSYRGGWWYKNCHEANLNGLYGIDVKHQGVIWTTWKGKEFSIPFTEMKMRPAAFSPPTRG